LLLAALNLLAPAPAAAANPVTFRHVVFVVQENRSTDNLFGSNPKFEKGVDIATSGLNSAGQTIPLVAVPLAGCYDLEHTHGAWVKMYDGGKMDGADKIPVVPDPGCVLPANPQFGYADNSTGTVQPYFDIATRYGFANRMFQTNQGPSFPAHQFLFGGTSAPTTYSPLFAAENTFVISRDGAGCIAPATARVLVIDQNGSETTHLPIYPCFEHPTLADVFAESGITWRYYTPSAGSIWTAPTAISHICVAGMVGGKQVCTGPQWTNNVVLLPKKVLSDIAACNLAQVTWVIPSGQQSDHAKSNDGTGPQWVASIVNAIGQNPACASGETYWNDTVILITWDDWGGWYDHVPPFRIGQSNGWARSYAYGFRVPLLVVSAYTPAGYVGDADLDFGSLLRFTEINFNLGKIGPGFYADAYSLQPLSTFFTLPAPAPFQPIPTTLDIAHFMNLSEPAMDPDDDGDGD
jgi:phospholipase C